jgi:hypothetical protein
MRGLMPGRRDRETAADAWRPSAECEHAVEDFRAILTRTLVEPENDFRIGLRSELPLANAFLAKFDVVAESHH